MAGIWRLAAAIATLLLVPPPLCAQEKAPDLTDPPPAPPAPPVPGQRRPATPPTAPTLSDPWPWLRDESCPVPDSGARHTYGAVHTTWVTAPEKPQARRK